MHELNEIQHPGNHKLSKSQDILLKISSSIISTLGFEEVLQIISDGMAELLEIETAAIYLLENGTDLFLGATTPPLDPGMPEEFRKALLDDHPNIKKAVVMHQPHVVHDTQKVELSASEKVIMEARKMRSLLYFPFVQEKTVIGVLILGTLKKPRDFKQEEINLGQTIANQLSIGMQNARLHRDLLQKNKKLEDEIQERKRTEQALRNSETHLSNALRIAKLGHWEYDVKRNLYFFTDEFYELLRTNAHEQGGYVMSPEEYASKFVYPDDRFMVAGEIRKSLENKENGRGAQIEHRIIYADGEMGEILVRYRLIKDADGSTNKLFGVNHDLTNLKKVENELKKHRDNLEKLVWEKTMELETTNEELKSTNEELKTTNDELYLKNEIIRNNNEELNATLSNLKETQARLIQSEKMASLGVLTAGVAHEINNPLNYIMGSYLVLEENMKNHGALDSEKIKFVLKSLKKGITKATNIVKGLNQFSREVSTLNEDCEIHSIIDNCLTMMGNMLENEIKIKKQYVSDDIVKGNIGQLHQAFFNILLNAVQAIKAPGEIIITTTIETDQLKLKIKDTGIGIDKENLTKITDPFFTTKDPGEGTGLGLSITYTIVKEHKGTLEFESEKGRGTTVTITLPVKKEP